jgi:tetratricopeptide (TPR) repeat protein
MPANDSPSGRTSAAPAGAPMRRARVTLPQVVVLLAAIVSVLWVFRAVAFTELPLTGGDPRDAYYNRLAAGLLKGQLSLDRSVPAGLAALRDPYDPAASEPFRRLGPENVHDLSYYRGQLYLYFGVAPAVVVFAPYHVVTGGWLSHAGGVLLFVSVGFLAQAWVLLRCWRRYFPTVGFGAMVAGIFAVGLVPPGMLVLQRPEVWEVAVTCAFAFVALALLGLWEALHAPRRPTGWIAMASICYGIAVGARPVAAPGAVILLIPCFVALRRRHRTGRPAWWRSAAVDLIAAVAPITVIVAALLAYNAARFGSVFEFGQRYQLAGDRQDAAVHFGLRYVWFHLRMYFFVIADWKPFFPFVGPIPPTTLPAGHGPVEPPWSVFANLPFALFALAAPWVGIGVDRKRRRLRAFVVATVVVFLVGTAVVCSFYAMMLRYECEFVPALVFVAVIGVFMVEQLVGRVRRIARITWSAFLLFSIGFNVCAAAYLHSDRLHQLAVSRVAVGNDDGAADALRAALRLQPHDGRIRRTFVEVLCRQGRFAEAEDQFRKLLADDVPEASAAPVLQWLERANRHDEAARLLTLAIAHWPRDSELKYRLATQYRLLGRSREALEQLQLVLQAKPRDANARCDLGAVLAEQGRMDDAARAFADAIELEPRHVLARFYLAQLHLMRGQIAAARAELSTVLEINPDFRPAREALATLDQ